MKNECCCSNLQRKGVMDCGAYRKVKLLEHVMKTVERELQSRI